MPTPSKILWLLTPVTLVLTGWFVVDRITPATGGQVNRDFLLVAGSLLLAVVISFAGLAHGRREPSPTPRRPRRDLLRVVQTLRLSARESIHAVEFQSKLLLIGSSNGRLTRLDPVSPDGQPVAAAERRGDVEFSEDGVDLKDTPQPIEDPSDEPRTLETARHARSVHRASLAAANLAEFRSRLERARSGG